MIGIRIVGPGGLSWESGPNHKLLPSAELIRDPKDPSQADLFFQPSRDLSGQRLKLTAIYDNDQLDTTTIVAGPCDPKLRAAQSPLPNLTADLGHRSLAGPGWGQPRRGRGRSRRDLGAAGLACDCGSRAQQFAAGRVDLRREGRSSRRGGRSGLAIGRSSRARDRKSIDVFFPPYRDESKSTMTLRLIAADGRSSIVTFPGGSCDPGKRSAVPARDASTARPGDDLQSLVDRFGSVTLSPGNVPSAATARAEPAGGAFGVGWRRRSCFLRPASEAPWSSAIKIHCGNTTLSGFAVRFEGPIRWNNEVEYGPAVIGMTDNFDSGHDDPKFNVVFKHLDLEIPAGGEPGGLGRFAAAHEAESARRAA